jgi:hypothetical protein
MSRRRQPGPDANLWRRNSAEGNDRLQLHVRDLVHLSGMMLLKQTTGTWTHTDQAAERLAKKISRGVKLPSRSTSYVSGPGGYINI